MALSSSPQAPSKRASPPQIKKKTRKPKKALAESEPVPPPVKAIRKRTKSPGVRVVGGRIYDSEKGQTCHQCRQKTMDFVATCKNNAKVKPCKIKFCHKCLLNRYGEKAEEVDQLQDWNCPKCREICNCSFCMKKKGQKPTGILVHTAKATGFQSVSEMLTVGGPIQEETEENGARSDTSTQEPMNASDIVVGADEKKPTKNKVKIRFVSRANSGANLPGGSEGSSAQSVRNTEEPPVPVKPKKSKIHKKKIVDSTNLQGSGGKDNLKDIPKLKNDFRHKLVPDADIPLPQGIELTTVAGIELPSADIGPALQFLEFCNAFEEILELKKGEAQSVLQELTSGSKLPRRQYSSVIPFHEKLLSLIQKDMGEENLISSSTSGCSWFQALGKCISESQHVSKDTPMECFDDGSDGYENLDTSKRLRLLNFFCDRSLCTKDLRGSIKKQNKNLVKRRKEANEEVLAVKDEARLLKQQMQDEIAKEAISRNGAPLSVSEHESLISTIKTEAAKANAEKLAAMSMVPKKKRRSDAVRTDPVFTTENGLTFWKLSGCSAEPNILLQDVGKFDSDESEKWFTYDVEQTKEVENYISHQRRKKLRSQVVHDSSTEGTNTTVKNETSDSPLPTVKNETSDSPLPN